MKIENKYEISYGDSGPTGSLRKEYLIWQLNKDVQKSMENV